MWPFFLRLVKTSFILSRFNKETKYFFVKTPGTRTQKIKFNKRFPATTQKNICHSNFVLITFLCIIFEHNWEKWYREEKRRKKSVKSLSIIGRQAWKKTKTFQKCKCQGKVKHIFFSIFVCASSQKRRKLLLQKETKLSIPTPIYCKQCHHQLLLISMLLLVVIHCIT